MLEGVTLTLPWLLRAVPGACLVMVVLGTYAAWDLRPGTEGRATRRRLAALLAADAELH
jgi:hypothetical protein